MNVQPTMESVMTKGTGKPKMLKSGGSCEKKPVKFAAGGAAKDRKGFPNTKPPVKKK